MTYAALLARLFSARRFGVKLELERMRRLLAALGDPQDQLRRVIHVGGTNGKGSTAAFCAALLQASGHRTALFSSPHLVRFGERFRIDGELAEDEALTEVGAEVLACGESLGATFFELVTAIALVLFARAGAEAAVVEVGLGGRFDATNVVTPDVAVVTGADFDHQEYLGSTIAEIAREKAGIFKRGRPAIVGRAGRPEAVPLLRDHAAAAGAEPIVWTFPDPPTGATLGLIGRHQVDNAACALADAEELAKRLGEPALNPERAAAGIASARWPGRLERIDGPPRVWIDGAHNPGAAAAIAASLRELESGRCELVVAVSRGKDVVGILQQLAPLAAALWCTEAPSDRAVAAEELVALARKAGLTCPVVEEPTPAVAMERARAAAGSDGWVLVAGSLFLAGEARRHLLGEVADPVPLWDPVSPVVPQAPTRN